MKKLRNISQYQCGDSDSECWTSQD